MKIMASIAIVMMGLIAIFGLVWIWPSENYSVRTDFEDARLGTVILESRGCNATLIKKLKDKQAREAARICNEADAARVTTNDLIQQTRAANAAERQAIVASQAARAGFLQAIIATCTLIAAGIAAAYSGHAASLAKQALKDQRDASAATDRPWLGLTVTPCENFSIKNNFAEFKVDIAAENIGSRVAQDVSCWIQGYQGASKDDFDAAYKKMEKNMRSLKEREHKGLRAALPGRSAHFRSPLPVEMSRNASLRAIAYVEYRLPNGKWGYTWEVFQFETADTLERVQPITKPTFAIPHSAIVVRRIGWSNAT